MRRPDETPLRSRLKRGSWFLATALLVSACNTAGPKHPASLEIEGERGFTITEGVRVSGSLRGDFERSLRMIDQGEYESGIALLLEVTEAAPELATAHIDLAMAYGRIDQLEKAERSLDRALELNPRHPVAHNEIGIVYRRTGRFEDARASYERALAVYPDFHFARRNLAILCDLYLGDLSCAVEHYERYSQAVPEDEAVAMWVADLRNRAGN